VAERFADGLAGEGEVSTASAGLAYRNQTTSASTRHVFAHATVSYLCGKTRCSAVACALPVSSWAAGADHSYAVTHAAQANLPRCIFGSPYRRVPRLKPAWLAWEGGTVPKLAASLNDEYAFDRLPILADALKEAGGDDAELLIHLRVGGPMCGVAGRSICCWAKPDSRDRLL
jgi:hypothetical protein